MKHSLRSNRLGITTTLIGTLAFLALATGISLATPAKKKMSDRDLFKEYCRPCHLAHSKNGEYTPMSYIQDQWARFFREKYVPSHKDVVDPNHGGKKVVDVISKEDLKRIQHFLVDHAADSEQPMTCG
ncbi:MAG: cytochrome c [Acidobacteriota bacterium]|jgi:hypothetical protein